MIVILCSCGMLYADPAAQPLRLSLSQALKQANAISVQIIVADARVSQAIARLSQAQSNLLPQLTGTVSGARQTRDLRGSGIQFPGTPAHIGPFNSFDARGKITMDIFDAGALERLRGAREQKKLSQSQMQKAREDVLALVAAMYMDAKRAQEQVFVAVSFLTRDTKAFNIAKTQYKQGTGSLLDLKKTKADYAQSMYTYRAALVLAKERRRDIAAALRLNIDAPILFEVSDQDVKVLLQNIGHRQDGKIPVDVQVAEDQMRVSKALEHAARADLLPKVTAVADYGRAGSSPDQGSNTYSVGLQATIPIWEGGRTQADLGLAKAQTKESQVLLEDAKWQYDVHLMDIYENIKRARALIRSKQAQLSVTAEELKLTQDRLKAGISHELDLDTAIAQNAYALDQQREAYVQFWMAKISLAHALGQMQDLIQ